jgi:hypothetical protein
MKWFIIAGIIIGGGILAYVIYSIYKATQKSSSVSKPSEVAPSGGYCNDEMCFAVHSNEHKEAFAASNEKHNDEHDETEPIENYSSIDESEEHADE